MPKKTANKTSAQARARAGRSEGNTPVRTRVKTQGAVHQTSPRGSKVGRVEPGVDQVCVRCTRTKLRDSITFRNDRAFLCTECDTEVKEERKEYHREYHRARNAALQRLVDENPERFEKLLLEERAKLAALAEE